MEIIERTPTRLLALIDGDGQATPWFSVPDGERRFSLSIRPVERQAQGLKTLYQQGASTLVWLERKRSHEQDFEARRVQAFDFDTDLQGAEIMGEIDSFWQLRLSVPTDGYTAGLWAMELSLS